MDHEPPATGSPSVSDVHRALCEQLSLRLHDGTVGVRVRLHPQSTTGWLAAHHDNAWHPKKTIVFEPAFFEILQTELDRLATCPHREQVQIRQQAASDWKETEFFFDRQGLAPYLNNKLSSHLEGMLFRDRHDAKQDVRRSSRTGPQHRPTPH